LKNGAAALPSIANFHAFASISGMALSSLFEWLYRSRSDASRTLCGALRVARSEMGPTFALISGRSCSPQLAELAPHEFEQPVLR